MMEYISQISLMTSDGMYSKVFAAWLFMLYAQLAGHCVHFLNVHCICEMRRRTGANFEGPYFCSCFLKLTCIVASGKILIKTASN